MPTPRLVLASLVAATALLACSDDPSGPAAPAGTQVAVAVEPDSASVGAGDTVPFAATVTGTADTSVTWEVVEAGGGTVDANGLYTAPVAAGVFHVRARSSASPAVTAQSTVTVVVPVAVTVAISPKTASLAVNGTRTFAAAVSNTTNTAVTWSVLEPSCGTITTAGVYTAPAGAATCTVVATSVADPTRSDSAVVTITAAPPPPITVSISPAPASSDACKTIAFTATVGGTQNRSVTWSVQEPGGGTIASSGVYTAPSDAGTYHVVATSVADPTRSASVPITVTDKVLGVAVTPGTITVAPNGTAQFTAAVTTTCGTFTTTQALTAAGTVLPN